MAGDRIAIEDLAKEIASELTGYTNRIADGVNDRVGKVTRKTVKRLRVDSPKDPKSRRKKHYGEDWTSETQKLTRLTREEVIHNRQYSLPHLVEKPHQTRNGGRTAGQPHIAPAEEAAIKELEESIIEVIENGGL